MPATCLQSQNLVGRVPTRRDTPNARRGAHGVARPTKTCGIRNILRQYARTLKKRMRDRPRGFGNPWLQLSLSVACVLVSEFLLKRGATQVAEPDSAFSWTGINGLASPLVWWAILLIIASFISWLYVLRYIPLTIAFPLSRIVDILVPLGCWIFLGESISPLRWCGIALVIIGLALVAKPIAQIEERL